MCYVDLLCYIACELADIASVKPLIKDPSKAGNLCTMDRLLAPD